MESSEIKKILITNLKLHQIYVRNFDKHFHVIVISDQFNDVKQVKRQQIIYAPLMKYFLNNFIHALSIQAFTVDEWKHHQDKSSFQLNLS